MGGFGLSSFTSICKKWHIHDEVCGLPKKKDESKFTGQSLGSYKKEAQEQGASILDPLQWVSKNRKILPKLSKIAIIVSSRHVILSHP